MNTFKCNITGSTSDVPLAQAKVPRRCGADPDFGKSEAVPGNCTYGAKQPFYWFQQERNNVRGILSAAIARSHRHHCNADVRGRVRTALLHRPLQLPRRRPERHLRGLVPWWHPGS